MRRILTIVVGMAAMLGLMFATATVASAAPKEDKASICERQPDKQNCPKQHGKNAGLTDVCPNIAGVQNTVPTGLVRDASGNCVPDTGGACLEGDVTCVPAGTGVTYTRQSNGGAGPLAPGATVTFSVVCDQVATNDDFNDRLVSHEISDPSAVTAERERHDGDTRQPWNDGYNATFTNNTTTPQTYTITITCERMR